MNKIFKVIWSKARNCYVVVSELAKSHDDGHVRRSRSGCCRKAAVLAAWVLTMGVNGAALAADMPKTYTKDNVEYTLSRVSGLTGVYYDSGKTKYALITYSDNNYDAKTTKTVTINDIAYDTTSTHDYSVNSSGEKSTDDGAIIDSNYTNTGAIGTGALAAGVNALATGTNSVAIGTGATAAGNGATVIGQYASASGQYATAFGGLKTRNSKNNAVIYYRNEANGDASVAFGEGTKANGEASLAFGRNTIAGARGGGQQSVAFGESTKALGGRSLAFGENTMAEFNDSVAFGNASRALSTGSLAHGNRTNAVGQYSTSWGNNTVAAGENATVFGTDAMAGAIDENGAIIITDNNNKPVKIDKNGYKAFIDTNGKTQSVTYTVTDGETHKYLVLTDANNQKKYICDYHGNIHELFYVDDKGIVQSESGILATSNIEKIDPGPNGYLIKNQKNATAFGNATRATAAESTAWGQGSIASGEASTAFGIGSKAEGKNSLAALGGLSANENSIAIGQGTKANNDEEFVSAAIGQNAVASGKKSLALGFAGENAETSSTVASGENALALGTGAQALAKNSISIGAGNKVLGEGSGAIGDPTDITGTGSYELGNDNGTYTEHAYADTSFNAKDSGIFGNKNKVHGGTADSPLVNIRVVGNKNTVTASNALVLGNNSTVPATGGIAIGNFVKSGVGQYNNTFGSNTTAIGNESQAYHDNAVAIGTKSKATGTGSIAIGDEASTLSNQGEDNQPNDAIAIGTKAKVERGDSSIAIGKNADILADGENTQNNIAIGTDTYIRHGSSSVVMGNAAKDNSDAGSSIVLGNGASVANSVTSNGIAIGTTAEVANTNGGVAIGNGAKATNSNGRDDGSPVAVGQSAEATGTQAVAIGYKATASGNQVGQTVVGSTAIATANYGTIIGYGATGTETQANQTAIGYLATTNAAGGVALGANSNSDRPYDSTSATSPYIPTGASDEQTKRINDTKATTGAVSVGYTDSSNSSKNVRRQIINVAAGKEDTDAVNVAQLKAVQSQSHDIAAEAVKVSAEGIIPINGNYVGGTNADGNILANVTTNNGAKVYDLKLNKDVVLGEKEAKKGGSITVNNVDQFRKSPESTETYDVGEAVKIDGKTVSIVKVGKADAETGETNEQRQVVLGIGQDTGGYIALNDSKGKKHTYIYNAISNGNTYLDSDTSKQFNRLEYSDYLQRPVQFIATLDDGMKYAGDDGQGETETAKKQVISKELNNQLNIIGGATAKDAQGKSLLTDSNIGVNNVDGKLKIQLVKDIDLTQDGSVKMGNTTIKNGGVTITPTGVTEDKEKISLTDKGLSNGGNQITHVDSGLKDATGNTVDLAAASGNVLNNAVNVGDLQKVQNIASAHTTVSVGGQKAQKDGKEVKGGNLILTRTQDADTHAYNYDVKLGNDITVGEKGEPGKNGVDGKIGVNGKNGSSVVINGKDGSIGLTGPKGADGTPGASLTMKAENGRPGLNGQDGTTMTRIVYDKHEVATLDDGQKYGGDNYVAATDKAAEQNVITKKLNERLDIKGGATGTLTDNNIGVNVKDGVIKVQLAQNLDLTDKGSVKMGNTTINNGGVTITPTGVTEDKDKISLTDKGLSNGGNQITHVDSGLKEANGNTVDLAAASGDVLNNAVNVGDLQKVQNIASAHTTVSVGGQKAQKDGKEVKGGNLILTRTQDADTHAYNYDVKLGNDITVGEKGEPGKNGVDGKIGVNGKNGSSVVINGKDGSIGLTGPKGADGTPGASLTMKAENGRPGLNGQDGTTMTRIVYDKHEVATLDDGQKYGGDNYVAATDKAAEQNVITKKLNERLDIKGGATGTLTDNNIGVNVKDGVIKVQLAQNLDLTDKGSVKMGNTTINNGGVTITPTGVTEDKDKISLTDKGLSNGGNQITHVDSGLKEANGNTVDLAAASGDVLNNAVNVGDLQKVQNIASAHTTVSVGGQKAQKDGKEVKGGNLILTRTQDADTHAYNYDVKLGNDITVGEKGEPGKNGVDGKIGVNGKNGSSVVINGKDGSIGLTGPKGADGTPGASLTMKAENGRPGLNGQDGTTMTRIVYDKHEVATLDDGQKYGGDNYVAATDKAAEQNVITKKLNERLDIKGGATGTLTDNNIGVNVKDGVIKVQLAQNLDLTDKGSVKMGNTTINNGGVTITPTGVTEDKDKISLTDKGLSNGGNQITHVDSGLKEANGNTVDLAAASGDVLNNAVNVGDLQKVQNIASAHTTVSVGGQKAQKDGKEVKGGNLILTRTQDADTHAYNYDVKLGNDITVGEKGEPGKNGVDGKIGVNGKNGSSVVINGKDGSIGLTGPKGADGTPGASLTMKAENGRPGLNGQDGTTMTRIVYDKHEVATLDDGQKYGGDNYVAATDKAAEQNVITKKLNERLDIKGGATGTLTDNNIGVNVKDGVIKVQLAQNLDLTDKGSVKMGNTTINNGGVTITPTGVTEDKEKISLTDKGLSNGGNQITHVDSGLKDATGNTVDLAAASGNVLNNAVNVGDLQKVQNIASAHTTVSVGGQKAQKDGKEVKGGNLILTRTQDADTHAYNYDVKLGNDITVGEKGEPGKNGVDGKIGVNGKNGSSVVINGKDGSIGLTGPKGADGTPGASLTMKAENGRPGLNGQDGTTMTRIVYDKHEVATLDDGQKYGGDNYVAATDKAAEQNVITKKLNERLDIKGGATGTLTDNNIGVNVKDGVIKVQLAQNLDLTDTGSVKMGNTTINNGGVTITPTGVTEDKDKISLTDKGLSNGGKQITHVDSGLKEANGNTVDLAAASGDVLNNAVNVGDLQKVQNIASAHTTVSVGGQKAQKDGKEVKGGNLILTRTQDADTHAYNYDVKLGNDITVGEKGEPGKNGVDGKIGVNGKNGSSVVINGKDGSIGLKGTDGANGLTIKGAAGKVGVDGKDGETRIVYEEGDKNHTLATLDDGQKYHGDFGETANVALNHQVNIVGDISSYNANHPDSKVKQSALTDGTANVGVETTKDDQGNATLTIKLNKNLTGLESVTAGGAKLGTHQDGDSSLAVHEIDANGNSVPKTDDNGKTVTDKAGTYVTGLTNKAWDGKTYVSGRAATEDQLMQITSSIVNQGATGGFGLSANGQNVKQDLGKTIAINGDGTYSPDGKETKAGNISTSVEKGAIKVFLNKDLNINSTTMEGKDKDSNTVSNVTNAEGSTITKTDANGKQSSTTVNAGSLTIKDGDGTTTIGGGKATIGGVTINGTGENDGSDQHKSTIKGLSNTTFDTTHLNQYNKSDRAATEGQLKDVYDMASKHTTVTVNGEYAPSTDGNLILKKEDKNGSANYDLALNNDITLGDKDSNGKLTVKSNDGTKSIITDGEKGTLTFKNGNDETSMKAADSAKGFDGTTDIKRVAVDGHTVATMDDGMKFAGDSGEALKQKLNSTTNIKGGAAGELSDGNIGVVSDGKDTLTVKLAKNIRGLDSVEATTVNATTVNSSSFNIAGDSNHSAITIQQGNVNMGGNTISGVAPGKVSADSMDAVNGSQLWQRDQAINGLSGSVNKLGNRINRVGAGAAALAALHPLDFDPDDKWDFAAGYGNYRGANAAAVGAYYRPNEDTMFSIGGSFGGGENMVNAGVSIKLGQGNHVSTSRVAMAKEIKDLRQNVANLNAIVNRQSALIDKLTGTDAGMIKDKGNDLFPDVPANHWAYEYVTKLKHAGILTGYPDGNFDGDRMMTRYEFAAIVYRAIMAGAASNPALNQDGTLDKLANEFSSEMKYIRIDTIAKDKNGKPTIERVRVISDAK